MVNGSSKILILSSNHDDVYSETITLNILYELFKERIIKDLQCQPSFITAIKNIVEPVNPLDPSPANFLGDSEA